MQRPIADDAFPSLELDQVGQQLRVGEDERERAEFFRAERAGGNCQIGDADDRIEAARSENPDRVAGQSAEHRATRRWDRLAFFRFIRQGGAHAAGQAGGAEILVERSRGEGKSWLAYSATIGQLIPPE